MRALNEHAPGFRIGLNVEFEATSLHVSVVVLIQSDIAKMVVEEGAVEMLSARECRVRLGHAVDQVALLVLRYLLGREWLAVLFVVTFREMGDALALLLEVGTKHLASRLVFRKIIAILGELHLCAGALAL